MYPSIPLPIAMDTVTLQNTSERASTLPLQMRVACDVKVAQAKGNDELTW
jgi:hypothetical protein